MPRVELDQEVIDILAKRAKPFEETTPNHVLRRLLGLPVKSAVTISVGESFPMEPQGPPATATPAPAAFSLQQHRIEKLKTVSPSTDSGFLTFLLDKHQKTEGNFRSRHILPFMQRYNLQLTDGSLVNPWKDAPYRSKASLVATVSHFRECRQYGCWGGRGYKTNCHNIVCRYHPQTKNQEGPIKNKCDLRKGVIWKRAAPEKPYFYGEFYLETVRDELLKGKPIPLQAILALFYGEGAGDHGVVERFMAEFHLSERELNTLFK